MKYVDGTSIYPHAFLSDVAGKQTDKVNPAFEDWIQQDQMVLSWLNMSLSLQLCLPPLLILPLCISLGYLLKNVILPKFKIDSSSFIVTCCKLLAVISRLLTFLISVECWLQSVQLPSFDLRGTTMVASHGHGGFCGRGSFGQRGGRGFSGGSFFHGGRGSFSSSTDGVLSVVSSSSNGVSSSFSSGASSSSMAPGPAAFPSGSRILCQICGRGGHAALDCYNRMNLAFEGRIPT
ncbi:unnamed protein product [Prunus armeniaca]